MTTPFAALPNILAGERLVPEFIQDDATVDNLVRAVGDLLAGESGEQVQRFTDIHQSLRLGFAERSADALIELARSHPHG